MMNQKLPTPNTKCQSPLIPIGHCPTRSLHLHHHACVCVCASHTHTHTHNTHRHTTQTPSHLRGDSCFTASSPAVLCPTSRTPNPLRPPSFILASFKPRRPFGTTSPCPSALPWAASDGRDSEVRMPGGGVLEWLARERGEIRLAAADAKVCMRL